MPVKKRQKKEAQPIGEEGRAEVMVSLQDIYTPPAPGEVVKAAFRKENSVVSAAYNLQSFNTLFPVVEGYDPLEEGAGDIDGYEMFADQFIRSNSPQETAAIKQRIDQEFKDRRTLDAGGWLSFAAQMAAGITDPVYLLTMFTGVGAAARGVGVLKTAARAAALSGTGEVLAESAKHASQQTRTIEESFTNIGGATVLSGILGGSLAGLSKIEFNRITKNVDADMASPQLVPNSVIAPSEKSWDLVNAGGVESWGISPLIRTSTSPNLRTKQIVSQMMESPLVTEGNIKGLSTTPAGGAVETRIKLWDEGLSEALFSLDDLYAKYRGGKGSLRRVVNDVVLRNRAGKLSFSEFRESVGRAFRRGDTSDIPEVQKAAETIRKRAFNPLKDEAVALKMLPEDIDVKTAVSYLTRVYRTKKIIAERPAWDKIVDTWLREKKAFAKTIRGESRTPEQVRDAKLSEDGILQAIDSITDNILGTASGRSPHGGASMAGPLKERVFLIPDSAIEDFLESDIDILARQYVRSMAPDVELTRMFGSIDLENQINSVKTEWNNKIRAESDKKKLSQMDNRKNTDIIDLVAMRDRLLGTYKMPADPNAFFVRAGRVLRDVNFMRMLGGMTLSAIPDIARTVAVNGLKPVSKGLVSIAASPKRFNIARKQARKFAVGLDMVLNSRASSMAEITDLYARGSRFERGLRATSDVFSKLTGMAQWNTALKQFSGVVTADRFIIDSMASAGGTLGKNAQRRLAQAGIGGPMAKRIAAQFQKHGDDGTLKLSNAHLWEDKMAFQTFRAAVLKEVDRTIVTPGAGEKPLIVSGDVGKLIFQFKTFAASAHHKVLLADLQHRDMDALTGFLLSVALGSATYGLKNYVAGREISTEPEKLIVESLDRSGAFGYLWDVNNITEKMTRGHIGVNPLLGAPPMSRYVSRNILGAILGPSIGTVQDVAQITGSAASGDFTKKDLRRLRQMLPGQNLFYMRQLLNRLEEEAGGGLSK